MSERLPYEEQLSKQWNDLPLPDENMAWADMKRRLDEEGNKRFLPFWLRGCAGWGIIMIVVLGLGWWIVRPEKWFRNKEESKQTTAIPVEKAGKDTGYSRTDTSLTTAGNSQQNDTDSSGRISTTRVIIDSAKINRLPKDEMQNENGVKVKPTANTLNKKQGEKPQPSRPAPKIKKPVEKKKVINPVTNEKDELNPVNDSVRVNKPVVTTPGKDSSAIVTSKEPARDSLKPATTDTARKITAEEVVTEKKTKKDSTKKLSFSAGIGLQQQLPVAGQKFAPYNSQGRKGTWGDYIPSVYGRLTRPGKWFLQGEFRYGAPQYTRETLFRQQVVNDTGPNPRFRLTTSSTLKKTYYHQLPVTFNYYLFPNWSLGAGIQWNKFSSAVYEKEILYHDNFSQVDSVVSKNVNALKKSDTASEFSKSYLQAVIETQYQWKRFSFGARYNFGLEPYIRFTLPGGTTREEKNSSLQLFIRFRLWKARSLKE